MPSDRRDAEISALRAEVASLLADALRRRRRTLTETARVQHGHDSDMSSAQKGHDAEMTAVADQLRALERAMESRDVIGQAKGIIMATMRCSADEAFDLLVKQSQAENRKVVEIATEIARWTVHRTPPPH